MRNKLLQRKCVVPENSHSPYRRDLKFQGGGVGVLKQKCSLCVVPEIIHTPTMGGIINSRGVEGLLHFHVCTYTVVQKGNLPTLQIKLQSMAQEIQEGRRGEWFNEFPEVQLHSYVGYTQLFKIIVTYQLCRSPWCGGMEIFWNCVFWLNRALK